jgi:hypothetical protein
MSSGGAYQFTAEWFCPLKNKLNKILEIDERNLQAGRTSVITEVS